MKQATLLATLLLAVLAGPVSAESFQDQILWMDQEHTEALFVPERVSQDLDLADLPIDIMDQGTLVGDISAKEDGAACIVRRSRDKQGSATVTHDLSDSFDFPPVVFVGRVVEVVEGWNNWRLVVGRMAYVEVEERIKPNIHPRVEPGSVFAIFFEGGETTIAGERLCFDPGTGAHVPAVGDTLLVGGVEWEADERHFNAFVKFPVVAGRVLPQPYAELKRDARSMSLEDLLREIRVAVRRDPN